MFLPFRKLPTEIRIRIWTFAASNSEPRIYRIIPNHKNVHFKYDGEEGRRFHGSSQISLDNRCTPTRQVMKNPYILQACRESRLAARAVFTILPGQTYFQQKRIYYWNTACDSFYFGGSTPWSQFQIFQDLLYQLNSTRPLQEPARRDVQHYTKVRRLIVDFNFFAALPVSIWTQFSQLQELTIAMYPHDTIARWDSPGHNEQHPKCKDDLEPVKATKQSKHGKRVDWIVKTALDSFATIKKEHPEWKLPNVDVVVRMTGTTADGNVQQDLRDSDAPTFDRKAEQDDDSLWYQQAESRLAHTITRRAIKKLKLMQHPSTRITHANHRQYPDKEVGDLLTDSKTEEAPVSPYLKPGVDWI